MARFGVPFAFDLVEPNRKANAPWLQWFSAVSDYLSGVRVVRVPDVDVPSLNADERAMATLTVPGARLGDGVLLALDTPHADVVAAGQVTANDEVKVWFRNNGAGTVDMGTTTIRVRLETLT